jgi:hypothetical protein
LVEGVKQKHPQLEDFGRWFLSQVVSKEGLNRISELADKEEESNDCSFFMEDILLALEQEELVKHEQLNGRTEAMIVDGFRAINQVWESDTMSLPELVAKMEEVERRNYE